ncbi:MAG TPA: class I SAM-dependent methyltransferase [Candidatus Acidoferrales bacterium]|nr:class I SAM-dependent methyltransferase [Candidatus Acidoferrales bacterium]
MSQSPDTHLWTSSDHALDYLRRVDSIPRRPEGEATLIEFLPPGAKRILDLGTGAGRLLAIVKEARPKAQFVGLDFSPTMLEAVRKQFNGDPNVLIVEHNFEDKLPEMGRFDAVISSFAIHHLVHERKRSLYTEIYGILNRGGAFCNLELVSSPTAKLHDDFQKATHREKEDPENKLLDLETQLRWLSEIGFQDVDCHWKWREFALLAGVK